MLADSGQSGSYHSESTRCALFRLFRAFRGKPDDAASGATGKMDGVDCAVGPALTFPFHGFAGIWLKLVCVTPAFDVNSLAGAISGDS